MRRCANATGAGMTALQLILQSATNTNTVSEVQS